MDAININNIDEKQFSQDERITKFLQGLMSKDEERVFLDDLNQDPDFKERAITVARLAKGISDAGKERDKEIINAFQIANKESVMEIAKKVVADEKPQARIFNLKNGLRFASIAASIVFILILGIQYKEYNHVTSLGNDHAYLLNDSKLRSTESPVVDEILLLNKHVVEKEDLGNTIHRLEILWELAKMKTYNAYINHKADIGWNLAIAYLKNNEKNKAIGILQEMSMMYDKDTLIGKDVRNLLDEINN